MKRKELVDVLHQRVPSGGSHKVLLSRKSKQASITVGCLTWEMTQTKPGISRRRRAGCTAHNTSKTVVENIRDFELPGFSTPCALCSACEASASTKSMKGQVRRTQVTLQRKMVGISLNQQWLSKLHNEDLHEDEAKKNA